MLEGIDEEEIVSATTSLTAAHPRHGSNNNGDHSRLLDEIEETESFHAISIPSMIFMFFFIASEVAVIIINGSNLIVLPIIVFTNSALFYWFWWREHQEEVPFDLVIRCFGIGFFPAAILLLLPTLAVGGFMLLICFSIDDRNQWVDYLIQSQEQETENVKNLKPPVTFGAILYFFFFCYGVNGFLVEAVKYSIPVHFLPQYTKKSEFLNSPFVYLVASICGGLGLTTFENLLFVCAVGEGAGLDRRLLTALGRAVFNTPLNAICAGFTGVQLTKRFTFGENITFFQTILFPAILHGTFEFIQAGSMLLILTGEISRDLVYTLGGGLIFLILISSFFALSITIKRLREGRGGGEGGGSGGSFQLLKNSGRREDEEEMRINSM